MPKVIAKKKKNKIKLNFTKAVAYIKATFNNTIVSIANQNGDVFVSESAGTCGFKGAKKSTPYAAQITSEQAAKKAMELGITEIDVKIQGTGSGRESAIRALNKFIKVISIKDVTPIPHNGCRPEKHPRG